MIALNNNYKTNFVPQDLQIKQTAHCLLVLITYFSAWEQWGPHKQYQLHQNNYCRGGLCCVFFFRVWVPKILVCPKLPKYLRKRYGICYDGHNKFLSESDGSHDNKWFSESHGVHKPKDVSFRQRNVKGVWLRGPECITFSSSKHCANPKHAVHLFWIINLDVSVVYNTVSCY